jgi:hypothetical protein
MFRPRYGYGYAGTGFAKLLSFLCPMLVFLQALLRAFLPLPAPLRYLWVGSTILLTFSAAVALILLMIGPWQNRLAGLWLGLVVGVLFYVREPFYGWAAQLSRHF